MILILFFLFKKWDSYPLSATDFDIKINELVHDKTWKILDNNDDFILLKRQTES